MLPCGALHRPPAPRGLRGNSPPLSSARQRGHGCARHPAREATPALRGPSPRRHAAARPARHRLAVHERILCAPPLRGGPACLQQPALSRARSSVSRKPFLTSAHPSTDPSTPFRIALVGRHRSTRGHRSVHLVVPHSVRALVAASGVFPLLGQCASSAQVARARCRRAWPSSRRRGSWPSRPTSTCTFASSRSLIRHAYAIRTRV